MLPSLTTLVDFFSEASPRPTLVTKRCLRTRLNTNQCQKCIESCPSGALSIYNRTVDLDASRCTGCMSCAAVCPQDALASESDLDEMLNSFQPARDVVVSCRRQAQNYAEEVTIPCVGILAKPVLAAIMLSGSRSVTFNLARCAECCNRSVAAAFLVACRQIMQELSGPDAAELILAEREEDLSNPQMDRRSYLRKICDITVDASKQSLTSRQVSPLEKPRSHRRIPFKTQLVKKMVTNLQGDAQKKILGLFAYNLSLDPRCNCCPLCKGICPTGAIKIDRTSQGKSFRFAMLDCNGCGLCVEFCKINALVLNRPAPISPPPRPE